MTKHEFVEYVKNHKKEIALGGSWRDRNRRAGRNWCERT